MGFIEFFSEILLTVLSPLNPLPCWTVLTHVGGSLLPLALSRSRQPIRFLEQSPWLITLLIGSSSRRLRSQALERCKTLMWLACQEKLLKNRRGIYMGLSAMDSCSICGSGTDSNLHALPDCEVSRTIWQRLVSINYVLATAPQL